MPSDKELSEEEKRLYVKGGLATVLIGSVIMLPGGWLVTSIVVNALGLGPENVSLLATFRAIVALAYPVLFVPTVILVAFVVSWIWRKSSALTNAAILCGFSGEFVLILIALVTLFDVILPGLSVILQVPLMAISLGIALFAMAKTAKIRPIRKLIEKSFR
jgi:hypothetical protein